jgi:DNA polymerase (family 10)
MPPVDRDLGRERGDLTDDATLEKIPGIGKGIAMVIKELVANGSSKFYDELRAAFPADILELFTLPGLGAKKVKALHEQLRVSSITQLQEACEAGHVAKLAGFGKTTQEKLCKAIADRAKHAGSFQLGAVAADAEQLREDCAHSTRCCMCRSRAATGDTRRSCAISTFIVATSAPAAVTEAFLAHPLVESVLVQGATKTSVRLRSGIQCDLRVVTGAEYPFALNYFTGSKEHNVVVRNRALQRGWTLNEYRLGEAPPDPAAKKKRKEASPIPEIREEADLYRALELDYIPPELRENCGELDAAAEGRLPKLIEKENIRGTFHCHTTASDGRNSLEEWRTRRRRSGCSMSVSRITARASSRRMDWMRRACARRSRRSGSRTTSGTASASSPAWSAISCATDRSISTTTCWPISITSSRRCTRGSACRKPR